MSDFTELEYKYKAEGVKLEKFQELMSDLQYSKKIETSSWDVYFTDTSKVDWFIRFRKGDKPELTIKRKVKDSNNWERIEVDLPLDKGSITEETVVKFVGLLGYTENFRIYKSCFIYWLKNVNFVYYTVYDKNMNEKGRFIEVEVNKECVNFLNSDQNKFGGGKSAVETLKEAESNLSKLGLSPQNRLKKSLFEMFYTEQS